MADNVIKFGKARKALAKKRKDEKATENRAKFGRTKAEKQRDAHEKDQAIRHVDFHKRENGPDDETS